MMTKKVRDFLDKELFVNRSIVTFRSLSRELGIHVNDAKNELQRYYDAVRDTDAVRAVPTYLVSGEVPALTVSSSRTETETQQSEDSLAMDVDPEFEFEEERVTTDIVQQSKVLLVDARALGEAKSQFSRIYSVHIYCLSPSRLGDAGLICTPSSKVQKADARDGSASFSAVGKITGSHVKLKLRAVHQSAASSSKTTLDVPVNRVAPKTAAPIKAEQQTTKSKTFSSESKELVSTTAMTLPRTKSTHGPKPSGKLDWSKAKTKDKEPVVEKTRDEKKAKPNLGAAVVAKESMVNKKPGPGPAQPSAKSEDVVRGGEVQQRGTKRKPHIDSDPESAPEPSSVKARPSAAAGLSVKKKVIYSDEDDDAGQVRMLGQRRPKRKSAITSDSEISLRVMMDIDDDQVDRVSRVGRAFQPGESDESEVDANETEKSATAPPATSDGEESDDLLIAPKKERKPRKVVPIGRNGLKKRRVVKSRTTTDAKGYMQTEDYSSYESIEEEEEVETKPKGKRRETKSISGPKAEEAKPKVVAREASSKGLKTKSAPKPRGGAPKRGGLLNFFGPDRGNK